MNNINNRLLTKEFVENTYFKITGQPLKINSINLYQKAFVHKSFLIKDTSNDEDDETCALNLPVEILNSNERLEFLGDSVLNLIVGEYLYDTFPDKDEGFLTKIRTKIVRSNKLTELAEHLQFRPYLLISSHLERITSTNQGRNNPRLMEDVFEGFLGALYKDQGIYKNGFVYARTFIRGVLEKYVNINELINVNDNFKDSLLRYYQVQGWVHPVYHLLKNESNKKFTVAVSVKADMVGEKFMQLKNLQDSLLVTEDIKDEVDSLLSQNLLLLSIETGTTKKVAEQAVSKNTLLALGVSLNY